MKITFAILGVLASTTASYANPFQNLGFDDADLNKLFPIPNGSAGAGAINDLLPGWQLSRGGGSYIFIGYNQTDNETISSVNVSLLNQTGSDQLLVPPFSVDGKFALYLGDDGRAPTSVHFTLSQQGDIPANAKLLTYTYESWPFIVSINGQVQHAINESPFVPAVAGAPTVMSIDVSAYAGQNVLLTFDAQRDTLFSRGSDYYLDNISFQVPEPSTVTLFVLGGSALLAAGFQRRRV